MILYFSIKPARGSFFGARFDGVGVGDLLETCDSSDVEDGHDTASDVCIRFPVISHMKSRNDMRGIGITFRKGNIIFEKATLEKIEKYFLGPLDSFTNECAVSQTPVRCINTVHMSVVIYNALGFFFATPVRLLVVSIISAVWSV